MLKYLNTRLRFEEDSCSIHRGHGGINHSFLKLFNLSNK